MQELTTAMGMIILLLKNFRRLPQVPLPMVRVASPMHGQFRTGLMKSQTNVLVTLPSTRQSRHNQQIIPTVRHLLPRVHRMISLLKRWLLGTPQGAIGFEHINDYLDEFTFRCNRRTSASRGKLFYRLAQQAVQVDPAPFATLIKPQPVVVRGVK